MCLINEVNQIFFTAVGFRWLWASSPVICTSVLSDIKINHVSEIKLQVHRELLRQGFQRISMSGFSLSVVQVVCECFVVSKDSS